MLLSCCFQNSTEMCEETKKDEKYRYREVKYPMKREHKRVLKKKLSNDSAYERTSMKCPKVADEKDSLDDQHYLIDKNNYSNGSTLRFESQNKHTNLTEISMVNQENKQKKEIQKTYKNNVNENKSLTNHSLNSRDPCVEVFGNNTLVSPSATEAPAHKLGNEENHKRILNQVQEGLDIQVTNLRNENAVALKREINLHKVQLMQEKEKHAKELQCKIWKIQEDANHLEENIRKEHDKEKKRMIESHQDLITHLERNYKNKELNLQIATKNVKEREELWEGEKEDVLEEIQNLKIEAAQRTANLVEDFDVHGKDKRRSLSQEVFVLQIIVEMKTGEMRNLREQVAETQQKMEQMEVNRKKLNVALARIEDLEEQNVYKEKLTKRLSAENDKLQEDIKNSSSAAKMMNETVDVLKKRIRENLINESQEKKEELRGFQYNNCFENNSKGQPAIIEKITNHMNNKDDPDNLIHVKSKSQSHNISTLEAVDEGLGDISGESEIAYSPALNMTKMASHADLAEDSNRSEENSFRNRDKANRQKGVQKRCISNSLGNLDTSIRRISIETSL